MPDICAPSLQEESLPAESPLKTETLERVGLPGVLTEANRITGGTSSSQRQLEHLIPEITRWGKANVRILLTETKTTHHHQNPSLPLKNEKLLASCENMNFLPRSPPPPI